MDLLCTISTTEGKKLTCKLHVLNGDVSDVSNINIPYTYMRTLSY